jgi:inosine/xanthosine triphosphatase
LREALGVGVSLPGAHEVDPARLAFVRSVRVGSTNGPKIEAVRAALAPYVPDLSIVGCRAPSGVPDQPVGFEEIVAGARNRALSAKRSGPCDLAVGIEDGLVELPVVSDETPAQVPAVPRARATVLNVGAAVVTDGLIESVGLSSAFAYPPGCVRPAVDRREPIGDVFDATWHDHYGPEEDEGPSGRGVGNIGKLSLGVLPRSEYGRHAVLCALVRFLHPELYGGAAYE